MQSGAELVERDYFEDRFTKEEVEELASLLDASRIFARRSPSLKQMGLAGQDLSNQEMVRLMLEEPKLVRRPLIRVGDKLMVGGGAAAVEEAIAAAGE